MNILSPRTLKDRALHHLEQNPSDYRKLVALHTAVVMGITLAVNLLQLLLSASSGNDAGLDGISSSNFFLTLALTLSVFVNLLVPFWQCGVLYTSIFVTRRQEPQFQDLTRGIRRFGPILRYYLLLALIFLGVVMVTSNLLPIIELFFPMSEQLRNSLVSIDVSQIVTPTDIYRLLPIDQLLGYLLPIALIYMVIVFAILIHILLRLRMSLYLLVDDDRLGAFAAITISNQMTRGHKWGLLKLELSFWWYYLLQILLSLIIWGPELFGLLHIALPFSASVANIVFQALYCLANIALVWAFGARIQTTYACAYEALSNPPADQNCIADSL